jgi:plasmid stabilization system protein ParE
MPEVIITAGAARGLERCRRFLTEAGPRATARAAEAIERQFELLESAPEMGRPLAEMPELRELLIAFGDSGYVALYRYLPAENVVFILAFRHQKEAGF